MLDGPDLDDTNRRISQGDILAGPGGNRHGVGLSTRCRRVGKEDSGLDGTVSGEAVGADCAIGSVIAGAGSGPEGAAVRGDSNFVGPEG